MLPEDIIQIILSFSSLRVMLAVGREPNATSMLLAGGPSKVLESVLNMDGDLKSIMYLKHNVPVNTAIVKAVQTHKKDMVKRVCILWETWCSDHGFAAACHEQFTWAIQHIQPLHPISIAQFNRIYFELRQFEKIDLSIDQPFAEFAQIPQLMIAERINEYKPYKDTLSPHELLLYHLLNNAESKVIEFLQVHEYNDDIDLNDALYSSIKYGKRYQISRSIFNKFGRQYGVTWQDILVTLVEARDIDAMTYFKIPHLDLHRAVLAEDVESINDYLSHHRKATLDVLSMYDGGYLYYQEALSNPCLRLDQDGYWQGAPNAIKQFMFGHRVYSNEWSTRNMMAKVRTLNDFSRGGPRSILQLLDKYGHQLLDKVEKPFYIMVKHIDKEAMRKLIEVLLVDHEFEIKEAYAVKPAKPSLFLYHGTLYHTLNDLYYEPNYLKSNLVFEDAMFMNDVLLALKSFADRMPNFKYKNLRLTLEC